MDRAGESGGAAAFVRSRRGALLALARPYQWIKNGLLFAALVFSDRLFEPRDVGRAIVGFIAFCAVSSTGYIINDIHDREADRMHPEKRMRPLAAGELEAGEAGALAVVLALIGLMLSLGLGVTFALIAALYVATQFAYSHYAKQIVIVDVIVVACGFVLRAYAGGVAIDVPVSPWLVFITFVLALFLALARRRHELVVLGEGAVGHRGPLGEYSVPLIDQMISIVTAATLVGYMIYTASPDVARRLHTEHLFLTVPFVAFGLLRYLYLISECDEGGDPARLVLRDRPLLISILGWIVADVILLYF